MKPKSQKLSARRWIDQSHARTLGIVTCFVVMLAIGWMTAPGLLQSSSPQTANNYVGSIQLAPDKLGRCESFELDNKSAALRSAGYRPCSDITPALARPASRPLETPTNLDPSVASTNRDVSGGSIGRVNGIADHFKKR
jgi:hypothetical protein